MTEFPLDATSDASFLYDLSAGELESAIESRFGTVTEDVVLADRTFTLLKPANADLLISEADYVKDERLPYWADLWPSARTLASRILAERADGRSLLELGCGLGLVTTAALAAGFDVTATDYYEDALHVTRCNAFRNVGVDPRVKMVNWRGWPDDIGKFDLVVAADVLYEREYARLVASCISRSLSPDGTALLSDPGRIALSTFLDALPDYNLVAENVAIVPLEDGEITREIKIVSLKHKS